MLPTPRFDWRDEGVRRVLLAMGPAVLGVSAAQISALINTQLAASLGDGRISWITYADRLMEFPSALLGVALGTVLLPSLAQAPRRRESGRVLGAARLGPAARVPAGAAGGGRAVAARGAADLDALPVRPLHRQRRAADARRAARLQRRPARADPGQDPGARLLRAADDEDAGEDRVRHGARRADAGVAPDVPARPRRPHAGDVARRLPQRGRCCSGACASAASTGRGRAGCSSSRRLVVALGVLAARAAVASAGPAAYWLDGGAVGQRSARLAARDRARRRRRYFGALWLLGFRLRDFNRRDGAPPAPRPADAPDARATPLSCCRALRCGQRGLMHSA